MRIRARTLEEIKSAVIANFKKDYPGEDIHNCPFAVYILDAYCRTQENYDLCRQMLMHGVDIDL